MFLQNILKRDTNKVKFTIKLFWNFWSLVNLSDISEVEYMEEMFFGCESLKYIRDISKWNIEKVKRMDYTFSELSKLNLKNLESAHNMSI